MNNSLSKTLRESAEKSHREDEAKRIRLEEKRLLHVEQFVTPRLAPLSGALLMTAQPQWEWKIETSAGAFEMSWSKKDNVYSYIHIHIEGLTEWRQLLPLFAALELLGYDQEKWTSHDDAQSYTRIYSYVIHNTEGENGADDEKCELTIHATLPGDTDDCRRVLVGYEKPYVPSETPRYEFRCKSDEGPSAAIPSVPDEDIPF